MKVGILTFPNSISYGACLQMIALQDTVRRLGHEAEIINYHNPYMKREKHTEKGRNPLKRAITRRAFGCLIPPISGLWQAIPMWSNPVRTAPIGLSLSSCWRATA